MILSLAPQFVFIANFKAASTTIEDILGPEADVWFGGGTRLKHMSLAEVETGFAFVFDRPATPLDDFFTFSVIRDPVDWLVSWFNFRSRPEIADQPEIFLGTIDFSEFVDEMTSASPPRRARVHGQRRMFTRSGSAEVGLSALIDHRRTGSALPTLAPSLGVSIDPDRSTQTLNPSSVRRLRSADLAPQQTDAIRAHLAADQQLYERVAATHDGVLRF